MATKAKQYLTGLVHRLEDGVLKTYHPGQVAPDWVTNEKILTDKAPGSDEQEQSEPAGTTTTTDAGKDVGKTAVTPDDDLTGLDGNALKAIADELGVKKNGKLTEIADRIRAKRAETAPAGDAGEDDDAKRAALIESLKAQGADVNDEMTEAELQAVAESLEEQE